MNFSRDDIRNRIRQLVSEGHSARKIARAVGTTTEVIEAWGELPGTPHQIYNIVVGDYDTLRIVRSIGRDNICVPYQLAEDVVPSLQAQGHYFYPSYLQAIGESQLVSKEQVAFWKANNR